jgi:hypothetical protein
MPKNVTPIPWGKQTICWYFHPVAKMTNSVTVAMTSNGKVKYAIRLPLSRCQGESPLGCGPETSEEFVEVGLFINELGKLRLRVETKQREHLENGTLTSLIKVYVSIYKLREAPFARRKLCATVPMRRGGAPRTLPGHVDCE